MFYYLSQFSDTFVHLNLFRYITFRTGMAAVTTFLLCVVFGPLVIRKLKEMEIGEVASREDCPDLDQFHGHKDGTPTMGGIFIVSSLMISVLLWADLSNHFVLLTMLTCLWLAVLGFVDDYMKLKGIGKRGLSKRVKLFWQVAIAVIIGLYVYLQGDLSTDVYFPFFKKWVLALGVLYIPFVCLVITGSSNAVNLTDGLDGLAIGCVLMVAMTLAAIAYIAGNIKFSEYLFMPYVPGAGELAIICAAIVGASLGFLWFNCHPATIFMGDVGSLSLGGSLGAIAVFIKVEILLAIVGGVFVIEAVSVILQILSFRLTGKRIFKVSPIHHHLQLSGWKESKIIIRFWILAIIFALFALTTLKIR